MIPVTHLKLGSARDSMALRRGKTDIGFLSTSHDSLGLPELRPDLLSDFIQRSQPWSRERVAVPRRLRWALWALLPVELFWAVWLATIVTGSTACRGPICTVTTLDHHAAALLACGVFSVAGLAGLIPTTRGFSRCNGPEVIGLAVATAAGGASLLGIAALITGALILLIILATFVLASTATSRRETDHERTRAPYPIALIEVASRSRAR
jgi:uncharacterized membrane protein YhaH (DUF805 family)